MQSLLTEMHDLLDKPVTAVATYGHADHIGGHHELDDCVVHPLEAGDLERPRLTSLALPVPTLRHIGEGDALDTGDRHFEVLHLPGHSPGPIALWEHATGTLFSGDAIYDGPLLDDLPDSSIDDYCDTMDRPRRKSVGSDAGKREKNNNNNNNNNNHQAYDVRSARSSAKQN